MPPGVILDHHTALLDLCPVAHSDEEDYHGVFMPLPVIVTNQMAVKLDAVPPGPIELAQSVNIAGRVIRWQGLVTSEGETKTEAPHEYVVYRETMRHSAEEKR